MSDLTADIEVKDSRHHVAYLHETEAATETTSDTAASTESAAASESAAEAAASETETVAETTTETAEIIDEKIPKDIFIPWGFFRGQIVVRWQEKK